MKPGLCPDMPLLVNDWLSSTRIMVMSPAQEGAFLRLLLCAWNEPDCTLPDDDDVLAEMSRLRGDWPTLGAKVRACFIRDPERPGRIFNEKQRRVRAEQEARVSSARIHAQRAATARWSRTPQAMPEHRASIPQAMPEQCTKHASAPGSRLPAPKGAPVEASLSTAERISAEKELVRAGKELERLGNAGDYPPGSKKRERIGELQQRQGELRTMLGVKA